MAYNIQLHLKKKDPEQKFQKNKNKKMDSRGIEPRTTPMLREYYTTKPQAQFDGRGHYLMRCEPEQLQRQVISLT